VASVERNLPAITAALRRDSRCRGQ